MPNLRSLTQSEARERASTVRVERYDLAVDLTGLAEGNELRVVSTVTFSSEPGASTFLDCAADVVSATLNDKHISPEAVADARIALTDLRTHNVLVVESVQASTNRATGVHRSVDPTDDTVYVWMSFEPDEARRAWACFDQPDLKAPHAFTVTAPTDWLVVSNSDDPAVEELGECRRWTFPATPPLSTYVPVVNAGPFYELRSQRGGYDLGLYARQSLRAYLDRDADFLFDVTARGLAFFGERFAMPFPQRTYDQVFVPEMGGAMENFGCVTWSDSLVFRSPPSPSERELVAVILLHEMAHMWFGDTVTMTWWDDLWLNEAFANWACYWAAVEATQFTDAWAGFLAADKTGAYPVDRGPTSHPIRQSASDVAEATAGFDAITYEKGSAVLKQLVAYVGEDAFVAGLRAYFKRFAWGNASLDDLMGELSDASGRDLKAWTRGWLDTAGTDVLRLVPRDGGGYAVEAAGPNGEPPRPHRLRVGAYEDLDGSLVRLDVVELDIESGTTAIPELAQPVDLVLLNDDDMTFATVQLDEQNVERLLDSAARLPAATSRAVAVVTLWDMVVSAGLAAAEFVRATNEVLARETSDALVEPFLGLVLEAAERWTPDGERDGVLRSIADLCVDMARDESRKTVAVRILARAAVTDEQLQALRELAADDVDLSWRALVRFAALGQHDGRAVEDLLRRDPDPDAWVRALAVDAARPSAASKDAAWEALVDQRKVPIGGMREVASAFWQPAQGELLAPFAERYLAALPGLVDAGMIVSMVVASGMFPRSGVGRDFVDQVTELVGSPDVSPVIRQRALERADQLSRMLRARGQA